MPKLSQRPLHRLTLLKAIEDKQMSSSTKALENLTLSLDRWRAHLNKKCARNGEKENW